MQDIQNGIEEALVNTVHTVVSQSHWPDDNSKHSVIEKLGPRNN